MKTLTVHARIAEYEKAAAFIESWLRRCRLSKEMLAALNEDADASPKDILKNVHKAVGGFVRDAEQFDDLTMLCVHYSGKEHRTDV